MSIIHSPAYVIPPELIAEFGTDTVRDHITRSLGRPPSSEELLSGTELFNVWNTYRNQLLTSRVLNIDNESYPVHQIHSRKLSLDCIPVFLKGEEPLVQVFSGQTFYTYRNRGRRLNAIAKSIYHALSIKPNHEFEVPATFI